MKKICVVMVLILLLTNAVACSGKNPPTPQVETAAKTKEISGTISVSMDDRYLLEAAQKFEALHPGVKVEFKELTENEHAIDTETYERLLKRMDTELMSGKGADIIVLYTGLPYKKYISHHMFVDLKQLMESDQSYDASEYYVNIFNAVKFNNGLYTLPLNYYYNLLGSDTELNIDDRQWNWQDLSDTVSSIQDKDWKYALPFSDENLFRIIVSHEYSRFVNDEKKSSCFNSQEFISLLKLCKDLSDKGYIRKSTVKPNPVDSKLLLFKDIMVFSLFDLAWTESLPDPDLSAKFLYRYPSESRGSGTFQTGAMVAINNASTNQNTAWEFLKFLISEDIQSSPSLSGFPVNKAAYKELVTKQSNQFRQDKYISLPQEQRDALMQKYARFNEAVVQDLKIYPYPNSQILNMVTAEARPFFAGKASAESTAQRIQDKVDFYLKE